MLSSAATELVLVLCEKIPPNSYPIMTWEEIAALLNLDNDSEKFNEIWDELKLNLCTMVKYEDEIQVCFTMTPKAHLISDDIIKMRKIEEAKRKKSNMDKKEAPMVKVDEFGNNQLVYKEADVDVKDKTNKKAVCLGALSGFVAGLIAGGLTALLQLFL